MFFGGCPTEKKYGLPEKIVRQTSGDVREIAKMGLYLGHIPTNNQAIEAIHNAKSNQVIGFFPFVL